MAHSETVLKQLIAFYRDMNLTLLPKSIMQDKNFVHIIVGVSFWLCWLGSYRGEKGLRDITDNLKAQGKRLYHLGMKNTSKATLAR